MFTENRGIFFNPSNLNQRCDKNVGMPNEGYILYLLNSHDADQRGCLRKAPEHDTLVDFVRESLFGHIWVCPIIGWDDPSISLRSIINDAQDLFEIPVIAEADH